MSFCKVVISNIVAAIACILALLIVMVARIVTQKRQGLAPTSFFTSPFCATRNFTVPYNFGFPNPLFQPRKKRSFFDHLPEKQKNKIQSPYYDFTEFLLVLLHLISACRVVFPLEGLCCICFAPFLGSARS